MTVEELLRQRSTYKALVTKSSCTLSHLISEGDVNRIQKHGVMMKAWFHSFDEASESYLETLTDDTDITAAESYYDAIYDDYMDQLDSLNYAMDSLTMQAPAVVHKTDSNTTPSTMSHIVNLPTMVREQETKASIHSVQLDDQNNETVPMNSHHCTSQPSPCQQVQAVIPAYTTPYIACRQSSCLVCHSEHQMSSTGHCSFVVPEQIQHSSVVPRHVHPVSSVINIGSSVPPSSSVPSS